MRNIDAGQITLCIEELFKSACREYPPEVVPALNRAAQDEDTARARSFLNLAVENAEIAAETGLPGYGYGCGVCSNWAGRAYNGRAF